MRLLSDDIAYLLEHEPADANYKLQTFETGRTNARLSVRSIRILDALMTLSQHTCANKSVLVHMALRLLESEPAGGIPD